MEANSIGRTALTFDIGTQSARAILFDRDGKILGKEQIVYEPAYYSPKLGWAEQDPDMYYDCMCRSARA
ncbi:MAG: carbohydrate kinase, partial [Firmicutes bacterium]|nr:carbohydrate kinase [Bacillota bacterium]